MRDARPLTKLDLNLIALEIDSIRSGLYSTDRFDVSKYLKTKVSSFAYQFIKYYIEDLKKTSLDTLGKSSNEHILSLLSEMQTFLDGHAVVKVTLSCEMSDGFVFNLHHKLKDLISEDFVLDLSVNADKLGGLIITYAGKYFDYSIKSAVYNSFYIEKGESVMKI